MLNKEFSIPNVTGISSSNKKQALNSSTKEKLFQLMKKTTEDDLGFFPADRDDFIDIYEVLKEIDLIDFTLEIFKNDKIGTIISPIHLTTYMKNLVKDINPKKMLITEAEKHLSGLSEFIQEFNESHITLTTELKPMYLLLKLVFSSYKNIRIIFESIYSDCLLNEKFNYIYTLPSFGYKIDNIGGYFITKDSDGIAVENMLGHLDENGILDIIVPAKITFAGQEYEKLRAFITNNYNVKSIFILPEGTFRPSTAIKTYLFKITKSPQDKIEIGTLNLNKDTFSLEDEKEIKTKEFLSHEDWRIELLLSEDDENIKKFKDSDLKKVKLKDVAEVFRGKSILKKDTTVGSISVLNISNIENGEINYEDMDTIQEEERKIKRYELINNDVVLSCRGTAIKSAVFTQQDKIIIASANVIVIRPKDKILGEYIKIFFESPIGMAIIKSFQRGTTIMNINYSDIMEMEIPLLSMDEQKKMIENYNEELRIYKDAALKAENRWNDIKNSIYEKLI
jgi:type I restriction-modification system DNA methylase subunit